MSALDTLLSRLRSHFINSENILLSDNLLTESVKLALEQVGYALGQSLTIEGLDGATATTLESRLVPFLLKGAAGHALHSLMEYRLNITTPSLVEDVSILRQATENEDEFLHHLEEIRVDGLQSALTCPHSGWAWEEPGIAEAGVG